MTEQAKAEVQESLDAIGQFKAQLKELIANSYQLVFDKLPKKVRTTLEKEAK